VFDAAGMYQGPLGATPREEYERPRAMVVMKAGGHMKCLASLHLSDNTIVCKTPEMTDLNASVVVVLMRQQSKAWERGSILQVKYLPQYKYDCEPELSGRCFDCCEAECQFQFEENSEINDQALLLEGFLSFASASACSSVDSLLPICQGRDTKHNRGAWTCQPLQEGSNDGQILSISMRVEPCTPFQALAAMLRTVFRV